MMYGYTKRRNRGAAVVEYVVTMTVIVSGILAIATLGRSMFDTDAMSADTLFAHGVESTPTVEEQEVLDRYHMAHPDDGKLTMDQDSVLAFAVFGICTCFFISNLARKTKEQLTERPAKSVTDGSAALRDMIYSKRSGLMSEMSKDVHRVLNSKMEVSHLMSTNPRIVEPECLASEVRRLMTKHKAHHLLVCNGDKLIGVISDRDLHKPNAKYASDLMTRDPISVSPTTMLIPTVTTMINKRISCLPVTENGILKGVLTRTDLLIAFQCMLHITCRLINGEQEPAQDPQ